MTFKQKIKTIGKLAKQFFSTPKSIFLILKDETPYEKYLQKKHGKTQFPSVSINEFLTDNKGVINYYTFLDGSSLITDLVLLKSLAQSIPECNYLEIGMWRGESILNVAEVAKKCTSINLSPQEMIEMGFPKKYAELHGCLLSNEPNIEIIHANSLTFDFSTLNQKYDLIFIDGDHTYEAVKSDTKNILGLLKDDNSIIVWHDYAYNPEKPRSSVIAAILDSIPESEHKYLYHVTNTLSAIYTKKQLQASVIDFPMKPEMVFQVDIKSHYLK